LKGIQQGKVEDSFGWNSQVKEFKRSEYEKASGEANGVDSKTAGELP